MLDADTFLKHSPFQITHGPSQLLDNTTPELLKFSLQEQHRNKLRELKDNHHDLPNLNLLHSQFLQDSFNNHLQKSLDEGVVLFDSTSLNTSSNIIGNSSHVLLLLPDTSISSTFNNGSPATNSTQSFDNGVINKPNYLNLKVLIENSVFDTKNINKDSILSLTSLKQLKLKISDKQELKDYLQSKFAISQQFMTSMILNPEKYHELDIDNKLLLKIIKLNHSLQQQLFNVVEELDQFNTRLNNHNMACLVLGYVEDIKITSLSHQRQFISHLGSVHQDMSHSAASSPANGGPGNTSSLPTPAREGGFMFSGSKSFENLFSHIASIAVKKNIVLPSPPLVDDIDSKIEWATRCIDSMTLGEDVITKSSTPTADMSQFLNETSFSSSPLKSNEKLLADYKTALNDLRFSHQYLTKEYEYSKETSFKVIQEFRRKTAILEKENNKLKHQQQQQEESDERATQSSFNLNSNNQNFSIIQQDLSSKEKEITRLRKELNSLKVDYIGLRPLPTTAGAMSPTHNLSAHALVGGGTENYYDNGSLNDGSDDGSNSVSRPVSTSGMSNGILRKEFKKIVGDLQDQYEVELGEERLRRRKLEEQIQKYEQNL